MTEERWIDKVSLKKRWGIDEAGLVKMVLEQIITPYGKNQDGKYYLMPFKREVITRETKRRPSRWGEGEADAISFGAFTVISPAADTSH